MNSINTKKSHLIKLLMVTLFAFMLTACGDPEAENRKAFIEYLNNTVMRSGATLPQLSEDQRNKLGQYTSDYAVLTSFSQQFNQYVQNSFNPMVEHLNQIRTPEDYITIRSALSDDLAKFFLLEGQINMLKSQAEMAYRNAQYPDDLKAAYDAAFKKIVSDRTDAILPIVNDLTGFTRSVSAIGDYLAANQAQLSLVDGKPNFKTAELAEGYNQLIQVVIENIGVHEKAIQSYELLNQQ